MAKQVFGLSISDFFRRVTICIVNLDKNRRVLDKSSEFSKLINEKVLGPSLLKEYAMT